MMHGFQHIVTQAERGYNLVVHGLIPLGDEMAVSSLIWRKKLMDSISGNLGYSNKSWTGRPWKTQYTDDGDNFFHRRAGVDWSLVTTAFRDPDSLFVVTGWNNLTKLLILAIRGFRKFPFAIWTDTVK